MNTNYYAKNDGSIDFCAYKSFYCVNTYKKIKSPLSKKKIHIKRMVDLKHRLTFSLILLNFQINVLHI